MLKPTGSEGGGSAATAAAQAAIADAVHNRVATARKPEERRKNETSFADEIGSKSRWPGRSALEDGGGRGRLGGGGGGRGGWETSRGRGRDRGGGRGYDRNRGSRDDSQDNGRRSGGWSSDRSTNNTRARESIFGSGAHIGMGNPEHENAGAGPKALTTTYVRQHGPPPRKAPTPGASSVRIQAPTQQQEQAPASEHPVLSTHSASPRLGCQPDADPWSGTDDTSKWRSPPSPSAQPISAPEAIPTLESASPHSGSYVRTHGPPRRPNSLSSREGLGDEQGSATISSRPEGGQATGRDFDTSGEDASRYGGSWGGSEHGRGGTERDSLGGGDRTLSGRWKVPAASLAPPPTPTNTRWKEPREEPIAPRVGVRKWKSGGRDEGQIESARWSRDAEDAGHVDGSCDPDASPSPTQNGSWNESAEGGWRLHGAENRDGVELPSTSAGEKKEQEVDSGGVKPETGAAAVAVTSGESVGIASASVDINVSSTSTVKEESPGDVPSFQTSFVPQRSTVAQPVIRTTSWEPQLPRGSDAWSAAGHGRDTQGDNQGPGQSGSSGSGASQPWSDPWGTSGFGISTGNDQGSSAIASLLGNSGPGEPRKDRYLPPALRNRTTSEGNQADVSNMPTDDQESETTSTPLPEDVASTDVSTQDLVIPGTGGMVGAGTSGGPAAPKAPVYEQQQTPLKEWQQDDSQAPHRGQQDQSAHPVRACTLPAALPRVMFCPVLIRG